MGDVTPGGAHDSPRWCDKCQKYGDHHTDRCPVSISPVLGHADDPERGVLWPRYMICSGHQDGQPCTSTCVVMPYDITLPPNQAHAR